MKAEPFPIKFNGERYLLVRNDKDRQEHLANHPELDPSDIGYCAIALFWKKSDEDYLVVAKVDDAENDETWTPVYEQYEVVDWMAGFTLEEGTERYRSLKHLHRRVGTFISQYGWAPDVVVELEPSEKENDNYITYSVDKDTKNGDLYVPED